MKHSLYFDTSVDPIANVIKAVHNIYGEPLGRIPVLGTIGDASGGEETPEHLPETPEGETLLTPSGQIATDSFEVDSTGMPFDARIHQNGKTSKGVWKRKKNVDNGVREAVEAELRAGLASMPTPSNRVEIPANGVANLPHLPGPLDNPTTVPVLPTVDQGAATALEQQAAIVSQHQESVQNIAAAAAEQQAAAALANAMAAAAGVSVPAMGRFATILANSDTLEASETAHMISNEVSACIGTQTLTLDDLAKVASELTGTEGTAAGFFTLINSRGFWPNIAKHLDTIIASKG